MSGRERGREEGEVSGGREEGEVREREGEKKER